MGRDQRLCPTLALTCTPHLTSPHFADTSPSEPRFALPRPSRPISYTSQVCTTCVVRMRFVQKDLKCCICKQENTTIYCTKALGSYTPGFVALEARRQSGHLMTYHDLLDAWVDDDVLLASLTKLTALHCPECTKEAGGDDHESPIFHSLAALRRHLREIHRQQFCDLCLKHRQVFLGEQSRYTSKELEIHLTKGDTSISHSALCDTNFKGHPMCRFCRKRFYDDSELYTHMERQHEHCHICRQRSAGSYTYYKDYHDLHRHFTKDHHACHVNSCLEKKFVVFGTEAELRAHLATSHGDSMTKAERKAHLTLPAAFTVASPFTDPRAPSAYDHRREDSDTFDTFEVRPPTTSHPPGTFSTLASTSTASTRSVTATDADFPTLPTQSRGAGNGGRGEGWLRAAGGATGTAAAAAAQDAAFPALPIRPPPLPGGSAGAGKGRAAVQRGWTGTGRGDRSGNPSPAPFLAHLGGVKTRSLSKGEKKNLKKREAAIAREQEKQYLAEVEAKEAAEAAGAAGAAGANLDGNGDGGGDVEVAVAAAVGASNLPGPTPLIGASNLPGPTPLIEGSNLLSTPIQTPVPAALTLAARLAARNAPLLITRNAPPPPTGGPTTSSNRHGQTFSAAVPPDPIYPTLPRMEKSLPSASPSSSSIPFPVAGRAVGDGRGGRGWGGAGVGVHANRVIPTHTPSPPVAVSEIPIQIQQKHKHKKKLESPVITAAAAASNPPLARPTPAPTSSGPRPTSDARPPEDSDLAHLLHSRLSSVELQTMRRETAAYVSGEMTAEWYYAAVCRLGLQEATMDIAALLPAPFGTEMITTHREHLSARRRPQISIHSPTASSQSTTTTAITAAFDGMWSCPLCTLDNTSQALVCEACQTLRPGLEVSRKPVTTSSAVASAGSGPKVTLKTNKKGKNRAPSRRAGGDVAVDMGRFAELTLDDVDGGGTGGAMATTTTSTTPTETPSSHAMMENFPALAVPSRRNVRLEQAAILASSAPTAETRGEGGPPGLTTNGKGKSKGRGKSKKKGVPLADLHAAATATNSWQTPTSSASSATGPAPVTPARGTGDGATGGGGGGFAATVTALAKAFFRPDP